MIQEAIPRISVGEWGCDAGEGRRPPCTLSNKLPPRGPCRVIALGSSLEQCGTCAPELPILRGLGPGGCPSTHRLPSSLAEGCSHMAYCTHRQDQLWELDKALGQRNTVQAVETQAFAWIVRVRGMDGHREPKVTEVEGKETDPHLGGLTRS